MAPQRYILVADAINELTMGRDYEGVVAVGYSNVITQGRMQKAYQRVSEASSRLSMSAYKFDATRLDLPDADRIADELMGAGAANAINSVDGLRRYFAKEGLL